MGDEITEEQLLEFCQRLGLARNGYLDEKDLGIVCKCIGVEVPPEKITELFEELDGDKDGKICLAELSQMFRGMQSKMPPPPSPDRTGTVNMCSESVETNSKPSAISPLQLVEKGIFTVPDQDSTGFTKVGCILDLWSQLGINQDNGLHILNEMGFQACSRSNSVNIQVLTKSIEDELDHFNEIGIPLTVQIALLTYRAEAQYLRFVCDGVETERDKLRQDIFEAHQRSSLLAQEIDEQNARLEKTNQALIQKMETKYNDQIHEMQRRFTLEKESLQQTIQSLESHQKSLMEEEARLRVQIVNMTQENSNLEHEVQILNQDIHNVNRLKDQLERDVSRFIDLENRLIEMEKRNSECIYENESELRKAHIDVQTLRDQNDELSVRLEGMKEAYQSMKASEQKRHFVKRRKGVSPRSIASNSNNGKASDDSHGVPLQKVGKYTLKIDANGYESLFANEEDGDSSMDPSLPYSFSQPDSGNFQISSTISLAACMGESSTDNLMLPEGFQNLSKSGALVSDFGLDLHYKSLENEMDSVKQKIVTIITEKEQLLKENGLLRNQRDDLSLASKLANSVASTQTLQEDFPDNLVDSLKSRISELEAQLELSNVTLSQERQSHQTQSANLETSLELLQLEYEKCEEYWQSKLQEARDEYELDRSSSDDKFDELAIKIQEYEDMFLKQTDVFNAKLPPIAECDNLEKQVNDLEAECQTLRNELISAKISQETEIENFQRKCEVKVMEECGNLEQQVSVLSKKCLEYENRLSTWAEEERSIEDPGIVRMLKGRVQQLEFQLKEQEDKNLERILCLERILQEKEIDLKRNAEESSRPEILASESACNPSASTQNKSLLEMLHQPTSGTNYSQRSAGGAGKSSSLPYFLDEELAYPMNGTLPSDRQGVWSPQVPTQNKKAWCHVELGWLQTLRAKLKQRDEQCFTLQRMLHQKDLETENLVAVLKDQHAAEVYNWETLVKANQELNRQHVLKYREQAEKLASADLLLKDLCAENAKLMAALNTTEQKVIQLENLLKFQLTALSKNSNTNNSATSAQHSLPNTYHFSCN